MFCPKCGVADQRPKAYCKRCGEWLHDHTRSSRRGKTPEERMHVMMMFSGINAVFALFSSIALYATYLGKPDAKWSVYLAAAFCMVIASHQTVSFFFAMELRQRLKRARRGSAEDAETRVQKEISTIGGSERESLSDGRSVTEGATEIFSRSKPTSKVPR